MILPEVAAEAYNSYFEEDYCTADGLVQIAMNISTDGRKIISFRGSDSIGDWVRINLYFELDYNNPLGCTGKNVLIHRGFTEAYLEAYRVIAHELENEDNVVFTGHSMGGALAMLSCLNYINDYPDRKAKVVTFGSPRVGNINFTSQFTNLVGARNFIRVTHGRDPIPLFPLIFSCGQRYQHPEAEHFIIDEPWLFFQSHSMARYLENSIALQDIVI